MRTRQIVTNPIAFTGKMRDFKAYVASLRTVVPITFTIV